LLINHYDVIRIIHLAHGGRGNVRLKKVQGFEKSAVRFERNGFARLTCCQLRG
jgi:hypothetical protein